MTSGTISTHELNQLGKNIACREELKDLLNSGNDMGVSTVGFRSSKFNSAESTEALYARFRQVLSDLSNADLVNKVSKEVITKSDIHARQVQVHSTNQLQDRFNDLTLWLSELLEEIKANTSEIENINKWKFRLENSLLAYEIVHMIVTDNLNARELRDGADKVQDSVELGLLKEFEVVNSGLELIKKTIRQADEQFKRLKAMKQELEADWSDKKEASDLECRNLKLQDDSMCKQFYPAAAKFQEIQSTPESWTQFTHDNLAQAEQERMASIQLRTLIDNILDTVSYDLIKQSDEVNSLFNQRISNLNETLWKLREDLKKVYNMIHECEKNIEDLKKCMLRKENTLKVAQTRLRTREDRPNVELTRDPAQYSLVAEVNDLMRSNDILIQKTNESENSLKDLLDERMALEKNIAVIQYSIFIEKDKCLPHRARYPSKMKLIGLN